MKQIRNASAARLIVPSLSIEADPGETCRIPNDAPIPDGWELVEPEPKTTRKPAAAADIEKETD